MGINFFFIFSIFSVIFSCFMISSSLSSDTLKQGDVLNSTTYLVSAGNNFTLGFLSLPSNSNDTYLGIWYTFDTNTSPPRPVWIGNRNTPVQGNSSFLTLDSTGKLIIKHAAAGESIELYAGQTHSTNIITATLLDNGNFVVRRQLNASGFGGVQEILWQSFDYPTDTLLPGMKLGINHKTGKTWSLTSWFAEGVPALGAFTLDWDPNARMLVVKRRGVIYWTSGVLRNKEFEFIVVKPDPLNLNYDFVNVTNQDEEYFTYTLFADTFTPEDRRVRGRWLLRYDGFMYDPDRFSIARVDLCYGYNPQTTETYPGCAFWEQPKCRNHYQTFILKSGHFGVGGEVSLSDDNKNLSISDCRSNCWSTCDCIGFDSYGTGGFDSFGTGCSYWNKNLEFHQSYIGGERIRYVLNVSEAANKRDVNAGDMKLVRIITAVVIPLAILPLVLWCWLKRKIFRLPWVHHTNEEGILLVTTPGDYIETNELENEGSMGIDLKAFGFQCIMAATNSFSSETKLGEGGFGPVYKGKLPNDREIAVKRLSRSSTQGLVEFKNELILIAKLQHTNLVRLIGYCIQGDEKMLIYEYMPNKSLDYFLFDPTQREQLTWERRFSIIEGIAQGLLYLHRYSRLRIIHRDLKASNILLDENMNAKISDFGMARMFKQNVTEANTKRVVGTYGYMAPEYAMEGIFSVKSDVFSFGVLLLEIVSGRRNNSFYQIDGPLNLVGYAWELWKKDSALELVDSTMNGSCTKHQLLRCIHIGLLCVEDRAIDRPTVSDVVFMLANDSMVLPVPKKPAFFARSSVVDDDLQKCESREYTVNGLTISAMDAR